MIASPQDRSTPNPQIPPGEGGAPALGSRRVLIVEDEAVIGWALESLLEDMDHQVLGVAGTGEAAFAAAIRLRPELLLMDIHLGSGPDGIEIAAQILAALPAKVIFVSAYGDDSTRARIAERVPGAPLVSKPASARSIEAAIASVFAVRQ